MIKKVLFLALAIYLLPILAGPSLVKAADGLTVLDSSAEMNFPGSLDFNISAESGVDIVDIRLSYMVDRMAHAQVTHEVYIEFEPATSVSEQWVWDMRMTGGLPPGSGVTYWWTVADAGGNRVNTGPARVDIEDTRYDWRSIEQGEVTLYWYKGEDSFAVELMEATQAALVRLAEDTGAKLTRPVKLYIYADSQDLQGAMIYPQEWTGGVAFPQYGIIAIGISPGNLEWGLRTIAHELTHLVIHQVTFNPYGDLPTWLEEGLAMNSEGEMGGEFAAGLKKAREENSLFTVKSLSSPFSAFGYEAYLGYAQSQSIVEFLIEEYGQARMFALLNAFRQGSSYDEALVKVYGVDTDGLNALWRERIGAEAELVQADINEDIDTGTGIPSVLVGVLAGVGAVLILLLSLFVEKLAWQRARQG